MKRFCILAILPVLAFGQKSLIGQAPLSPDPDKEKSIPRLDVREIYQSLEPMPSYTPLPASLPPEIQLTAEEYQQFVQLKKGNEAMRNENPEQAKALYSAYLEMEPENIGVRTALADSLFALNEYTAAKEQYLYVLNREPFHFQSLNNLAWMHATTGEPEIYDPETGLKYALRAQLISRNSHHVWSTLSKCYYELNQYRDSAEAAQTALVIAQNSNVPSRTIINYLIQLEKCRVALEATSILE